MPRNPPASWFFKETFSSLFQQYREILFIFYIKGRKYCWEAVKFANSLSQKPVAQLCTMETEGSNCIRSGKCFNVKKRILFRQCLTLWIQHESRGMKWKVRQTFNYLPSSSPLSTTFSHPVRFSSFVITPLKALFSSTLHNFSLLSCSSFVITPFPLYTP
jgi:hypothetical protein